MNIFILEDDFKQQTRIETIVRDVLKQHRITCHKLEVNGKPDQLLAEVSEVGSHQIFFLDIEIKTETQKGFAVAEQIRARDPYAAIVFVTTHSEFMPLAFEYKVSAVDYVDKGLSDQDFYARIESDILAVHQKLGTSPILEMFSYDSAYTQLQVPLHEVLYLETSTRPHRVVLYTMHERMEFTGNLSDIADQNQALLACHRSYLVNPRHVSKIDKADRLLYLHNGETCLIARSKLRQTLAQVRSYQEGKL